MNDHPMHAICRHCGKENGDHSAMFDRCPSYLAHGPYHPTSTFEPLKKRPRPVRSAVAQPKVTTVTDQRFYSFRNDEPVDNVMAEIDRKLSEGFVVKAVNKQFGVFWGIFFEKEQT